jgi:hypothetical protein
MLLLAALFVVVLSGTVPHHPQWPGAFSTTAIVHETGRRRPEFIRWFYSTAQNIDRVGESVSSFFFFLSSRFAQMV